MTQRLRRRWLRAAAFSLALAACNDEIVEVDLPKDASPDRAADGGRDAANETDEAANGAADGSSTDAGSPEASDAEPSPDASRARR